MYGSAIITLLGMPVTGYSVAVALSSGSFKYKRYLINMEIEQLLKYQEMNAKNLRVLHEKEDLMRKLIDIQVQKVKIGIDLMYEQSNRKTQQIGNLKESMLIMKQLEKSTEHMRASSFMSLTVFDAMSIKVLDENYL